MSEFVLGSVLRDSIAREIAGKAYTFVGNDRDVLAQMCDEINRTYPSKTSFEWHYLSQMALQRMPAGSSSILLKYIYEFESESCRAVLVKNLVLDKVKIKGLDRIIMDLYHHFRASSFYLSTPGTNRSSTHIYIAYDNALAKLKSLAILPELVELMKFRREVYILGVTLSAITKKWTPPELGDIMATHLMNKEVTKADVGLPEEGVHLPNAQYIAKLSTFNAIACLQHYPSEEHVRIISEYTNHSNEDLRKFAQEQAKLMADKLAKN